jgi:hypothetical protein
VQVWQTLVVAGRWLWAQISRLNPTLDSPWEELGQGQYETRLLERSMYKICALLAVGFGDAGAQVIAENMKLDGDLNPMLPGKKTVSGGVPHPCTNNSPRCTADLQCVHSYGVSVLVVLLPIHVYVASACV